MRTLSAPIAEGRTADVYSWDDTHILKLYRDWCPSNWVEYEARVGHAINAAGVPSPAVGEIVEVDGRRGLIYERLEGISMLQDLNAHPWTFLKHARGLAELHLKINQLSIADLPSYKDGMEHSIHHTPHLSDELREKALALLKTLPDGANVCHGDYHPGNVIITKQGPVAIDWMTAKSGSCWADVARTNLLLTIGVKGAGRLINPLVRILVRLFHRSYLARYVKLGPDSQAELTHWMPVVAAARLYEDIVPERKALIDILNVALQQDAN